MMLKNDSIMELSAIQIEGRPFPLSFFELEELWGLALAASMCPVQSFPFNVRGLDGQKLRRYCSVMVEPVQEEIVLRLAAIYERESLLAACEPANHCGEGKSWL